MTSLASFCSPRRDRCRACRRPSPSGKPPNILFDDVARARDDFYAKAIEGFTLFALNKGEICSCPSRALIQDGIFGPVVTVASGVWSRDAGLTYRSARTSSPGVSGSTPTTEETPS